MYALISVSDKRNLTGLAQGLHRLGYQLLSTGGTLRALLEAGVPARSVAEHTGSPEILDGRVKTLHPKIHGGLLGRPEVASDLAELRAHDIPTIDLLVVNLYPFRETVARGAPEDEIIENIDVGGPAMIRAAAKNSGRVNVLVDPDDYESVLSELQTRGATSAQTRRALMRKAFAHTAAYDAAVAGWLCERDRELFPNELALGWRRAQVLRYGENPHQQAAVYRETRASAGPTVVASRVLQGKELSYNNLLDLDAALGLLLEFSESPAAVVVKHNTPCGVAVAAELESAFRRARAVDEISAFGGIVALNRPVGQSTAAALAETFLECVLAPSFSDDALAILGGKKNLRLLEAGAPLADPHAAPQPRVDLRSIAGGLLVMERDAVEPPAEWRLVTRRAPSPEELAALRFAWRVVKHVKSNAVAVSSATELLAVGGGQTSRVEAVRQAIARGGERLAGCAVASDAFFPFRDGVDLLAAAGVRAVVQPGGSVRDAEVIAAADEHNVAMLFTGVRHFRH